MSARLFLAYFAAFLLAHFGFSATTEKPLWTCGMHPQIIKSEPGNCPICGMKLTPIRATGVPSSSAANSNRIALDDATVQRMNLRIGDVTRGPVRREIRTVGTIAYNEEGFRDVTTKYEGWLEKLYVNSTYASVKAGDPLFEIYSPDLYNAELNLLVAHGSEGESNGPLTRAALGRLQLFDLPKDYIADLLAAGKAPRTFVYRAPAAGVVIEKIGVVGQMVKPGDRIYRLADLSTVWVQAQVYEQDLPYVHTGDAAQTRPTYGSDHSYAGVVSLVIPQVEEQTRAATARIVLPNPEGTLRPGMYVDVRLEAQIADSAVLVPETAILRSGDRNTVFVAQDAGTFEPRSVKLGARSGNGDYEVLSGLREGEHVVTSGQFMLDSESQLREAIAKMSGGAGTPPPAMAAGEAGPRSATAASPQLLTLALATADAAAALAADDLSGFETQRAKLNEAVNAWLTATGLAEAGPGSTVPASKSPAEPEGRAGTPPPAAAGNAVRPLPPATDLKSARVRFEPFSTAVTDLVRDAHLPASAGLHVFECPMSPTTGKARWLQRTAGTQNPFYGSAMPTCGEEMK